MERLKRSHGAGAPLASAGGPGLVLGDQHPDHAGTGPAALIESGSGRATRSRKPSCGSGSAVRVPPRATTRSCSPARPLPGLAVPPPPSSTTSTIAAPARLTIRIAQHLALLWRITFV